MLWLITFILSLEIHSANSSTSPSMLTKRADWQSSDWRQVIFNHLIGVLSIKVQDHQTHLNKLVWEFLILFPAWPTKETGNDTILINVPAGTFPVIYYYTVLPLGSTPATWNYTTHQPHPLPFRSSTIVHRNRGEAAGPLGTSWKHTIKQNI